MVFFSDKRTIINENTTYCFIFYSEGKKSLLDYVSIEFRNEYVDCNFDIILL